MLLGKGLSRASTQLGLLGSVCLHLTLTLWVANQGERATTPVPTASWPTYSVELEVSAPRQPDAKASNPELTQTVLTGSLIASAADTWQQGGMAGGAIRVVNLGSRIGESAIRDVTRNNGALDQLQRIRTSRERRSAQRARQTPNPAVEAVLSTGAGKSDARQRNLRRPTENLTNAEAKLRKADPGLGGKKRPSREAVDSTDALARAASSQTLRPDLERGRAATDTMWHAPTPADNVNSTSASLSVSDGNIEQTPSKPGHGGVGRGDENQLPGARSLASSPARGPIRGPVGNAAYDQWLAKQRKAIGDELRFPNARKVSLDQGLSVYELLLSKDGRVLKGPALVRSSGFDDFDSEGRRAIEATQFSPLPRSLTIGDRPLKVTMVVRFFNPMTF